MEFKKGEGARFGVKINQKKRLFRWIESGSRYLVVLVGCNEVKGVVIIFRGERDRQVELSRKSG